ncbi:MAG: dinitrogenase iron-molybdenum cofactor biosynthesis protein [Methanobacterium sp. ERen5]|nr:MAG: dinitrogenase iron-molybdenum cofactor biosynthesis protein [Methanobacterium sp. ERen5]
MPLRVAVASSDGKFINQHFGHAEQFLIFDIDDGGNYEYLELRKNEPTCSGGNHTAGSMKSAVGVLDGVKVVLVAQIGPGATQNLLLNGIQSFSVPSYIDEALEKLGTSYSKKLKAAESNTDQNTENQNDVS